ncbi:MAG: ABC transporter permease [Rhodospirillales bacterium]|nr:ABC transporter permease [Acetobacter sp.]
MALSRNIKLYAGAGIVLFILFVGLLAPWIAPHDPLAQNLIDRLKPPIWMSGGSSEYLLGTDNYGRDLLSRLIYGARVSLLIATASMLLSCAVGVVAGMLAGFKQGKWEVVIMRLADAHSAFPQILLAIVAVAAMGGGMLNLILVLGVSQWMIYARVIYNMTRAVRERSFIEAARSFGARDAYLLRRHIFPQLVPVVIVLATLQVAQMILQETALSFLGLGVPQPALTWGNVLAEGRDRLFGAPWIANSAGIAIVVLVLAVNLVGSGLRQKLAPSN